MELDSSIIYSHASDFLKEDIGRGDITTRATVRPGVRARGRFMAKQNMVLCGLEFAEAVFAIQDSNIQLESRAYDGDTIQQGTEFAIVEGPATVLLGGERTALNLLQQLSGVATATRAFVDRIAGTGAQILDTRKTTPGLRVLEKYAVSVGGGRNHRSGLDDGILIKDNHIAMAGGVKRAVELARRNASHLMKVEIEVSTRQQLIEALATGAEVIMLDNMSVDEVRESVGIVRERPAPCSLEVSGGITLDTVREYAETGVDFISTGAITHSAPSIDISMKITPL